MSVLNQAAVEALCSGTYLENYLDTLDTLPDDLQRIVSHMREIDFQYNELLKDINAQKDVIEAENNPDSVSSKKASIALQRHLIKGQELGDEQLQLSSLLIEYIENRTRQLEQDLENLDPTLGREPETETIPVSVTPSKSSKSEHDHHSQPTREKKKVHRRKTSEQALGNNRKEEEPLVPPRKKVKSQHQQQQQQEPVPQLEEKPKEVVKKKKKRKVKKENKEGNKSPLNFAIDPDEPVYCSCRQVSYGEMIGCDNERCVIEWFHFNCVNLTNKPKGKWYCPECRGDRPNVIRPDLK